MRVSCVLSHSAGKRYLTCSVSNTSVHRVLRVKETSEIQLVISISERSHASVYGWGFLSQYVRAIAVASTPGPSGQDRQAKGWQVKTRVRRADTECRSRGILRTFWRDDNWWICSARR